MSKHGKPWTFEPMELWSTPTWEVYDPNLGRIVAVYYDRDEAEKELARINRKQAKKKAKKGLRPPVSWIATGDSR